MPSEVTYTGFIGPSKALTEKVFPDVRRFALDFDKRTLQLNYYRGDQPKEAIVDMQGDTVTLTDTVTANDHAIVISVS